MDALMCKRDCIKSRLSTFETIVTNLTQKTENLTELEIANLGHRMKDCGNLVSQFERVQLQIKGQSGDTSNDYTEIEEFESKFYCVMASASVLLKSSAAQTQVSETLNANSNAHETTNGSSRSNNSSALRLPSITIEVFDGSPANWIGFRDLFVSLVHDNTTLSNIEKMTYLVSSLKGEALESIGGLSICNSNYLAAWETLSERYNSSRSLIFFHMKELFNTEIVTKESARGLRNLVDSFKRNKRALESLLNQDELKDALLMHLLQTRMDQVSLKEFESHFNAQQLPCLDELITFIERKASLLETVQVYSDKSYRNNTPTGSKTTKSRSFVVESQSRCLFCNETHLISSCKGFLSLDPKDRWEKAKHLKLCLNCLSKSHFSSNCTSKYACRICKRRHHTVLHFDKESSSKGPSEIPQQSVNASENLSVSESNPIENTSALALHSGNVLLPTAQVVVFDKLGSPHYAKALLDSGSMSSFVSETFFRRLQLKERRTNISISGINQVSSCSNAYGQLLVHSVTTGYKLKVDCLIIPKITSKLPPSSLDIKDWEVPHDKLLADPTFNYSSQIDILIGADYFWNLLLPGRHNYGRNRPVLQETTLGWIISGPLPFVCHQSHSLFCKIQNNRETEESLTKFWELEEVPTQRLLSKEEQFCEHHFVNNFSLNDTGRFTVRIPFKQDPNCLGDSFDSAKRRFFSLERKLSSNPQFKQRYVDFMNEYLELGHMSEVSSYPNSDDAYFLPHHGVLREESVSTKLRVVFDGSAPSSTGVSLNQLQAVGPVIQSSLFSILIRFRSYTYVFSADVHKMYRQILISEEQRRFQRILWRCDSELPLRIFELNTVTYGTSSASFLATRCLLQIGLDCASSNPDISRIVRNDFYVDDVLSGSNSYSDAQNICQSLHNLLSGYGFPLRKWLSNDPTILSGLDNSEMHPNLYEFSSASKTLGLLWSNISDQLTFSIPLIAEETVTKRFILSRIAQVFDPLGLIQPCTMRAKFLIQRLWLEKVQWDETPSTSVVNEWLMLKSQLPELERLNFTRHAICKGYKSISLHAFSDASIHGFGSCVYLRSVSPDNKVVCHLLCSKGKVAPLRTISIPRLELCAGVVSVNLVKQVTMALNVNLDEIVFWTDSTILLCWLKMHPNKLCTFVANRVALIQELSANASWRHVDTKSNPSDLVSRGASPSDLLHSEIWVHGPPWLIKSESDWPTSTYDLPEIPEVKTSTTLVTNSEMSFDISNYSDLNRLKRIIAYCKRFSSNCRKPLMERTIGTLSLTELNESMTTLIKISQSDSFSSELQELRCNRAIKSTNLKGLMPFLDQGVMLVGGRLRFASYPFEKRHPSIIHGRHPIAKLLVESEHRRLLHAGPQHLLASIRERYWIIGGRNLCKKITRSCVTCFRQSPKSITPVMGNLPRSRVEQSYPFQNSGVDYGGPFLIKDKMGRGCKITKCYLCLFICFSTKAVHLELVSSLSTESFIQCLRRFVSRRGKPSNIYSDNGSNFIGAKNFLKDLSKFLKENKEAINEFAVDHDIVWHFIPSYSPHFGGIWERAIRSAKYHLRRILTKTPLTFEELSTLFTQIEAIMNSRPVTTLSSHPEDFNPLTPGHFLIGRPLTAVPDFNVTTVKENRLSRFEFVQQLTQHFWERWRKEYLQTLQTRNKWQETKPDLQPNSVVLLKQDNLPPLQWRMGRILELHTGPDAVPRVASVRTSTGVVRRAVSSLCPLPINI